MVGLPASGKSTRVEAMTENAFVYSTDSYIDEVAAERGTTYDKIFSETAKEAKIAMDTFLANAIENGRDVIWDQTNLTAKKRRHIMSKMSQAGYEVVCECFEAAESIEDIAEWNRRLESREGKTIPKYIIDSMAKTYTRPSVEEGFSEVSFYNLYGKLIAKLYTTKL